MKKLADISAFERLQNNANAGFVSDLSVFNIFDYRSAGEEALQIYRDVYRKSHHGGKMIDAVPAIAQYVYTALIDASDKFLPQSPTEIDNYVEDDMYEFQEEFIGAWNDLYPMPKDDRDAVAVMMKRVEDIVKEKVKAYVSAKRQKQGLSEWENTEEDQDFSWWFDDGKPANGAPANNKEFQDWLDSAD